MYSLRTEPWRAIKVATLLAVLASPVANNQTFAVSSHSSFGEISLNACQNPMRLASELYAHDAHDKHYAQRPFATLPQRDEWIARANALCQTEREARQKADQEQAKVLEQGRQAQQQANFEQQARQQAAQQEQAVRQAQQEAQLAANAREYVAQINVLHERVIQAGYEPISAKTFALDAKDLAASGKKIAVFGFLSKIRRGATSSWAGVDNGQCYARLSCVSNRNNARHSETDGLSRSGCKMHRTNVEWC